ncbi:GNAT family N-acetyltransferase [Spirosoma sp. SC4-14]|uniref:GNAT family N-acetyltransferase n=1 Tax=Spirosoma sp. SC4-14 TaxID=3128900 RepID=UPI0030CF9985
MLTYRKAQPSDVQLYFDWANDLETRQQSFNSREIPLETHTAWFTKKLTDPDALLLLFEDEQHKAVGQVRFERKHETDMPAEIIVGVSVDARVRGQGFASQIITQGCEACKEQWGAVTIHAYIKADNQGSVRSFQKAGFKFSHGSGKFNPPGQEGLNLVYVKTL